MGIKYYKSTKNMAVPIFYIFLFLTSFDAFIIRVSSFLNQHEIVEFFLNMAYGVLPRQKNHPSFKRRIFFIILRNRIEKPLRAI
jgi:hypothetical protein